MNKSLNGRRATRMLWCTAFALLVSGVLLAAGLKKYKKWEESPQAYFLTKAERSAWQQIQTDDEAEKFIADYLSKRGVGFSAELDKRIAMADKYLSSGKQKGSETLRGKVVILLGPPSSMDRKEKTEMGRPESAEKSDVYSNVGGLGAGAATVRIKPTIFTLAYDGDRVPKVLETKRLVIKLEQETSGGKERSVDEKGERPLDEIFELVAQASIPPVAAEAAKAPGQ